MSEVTNGSRGSRPLAESLQIAGEKLELPPDHPAVLEYVRLERQLEEAQKDPLTGFWLPGPGFRKLEERMSVVENTLAGFNGADAPNALMVVVLDVEGLHYTNNWYGQLGGDARLKIAGRELREVAGIVRSSSRAHDRRSVLRGEESTREPDLLIRTGGDEMMAAMSFHEKDDNTKEAMTERVTQRLSQNKAQNAPNLRILYGVGFFTPGTGQTPEDLYHSAEPKARMSQRQKLARPIFKIVRLGLGQYRPPARGEL